MGPHDAYVLRTVEERGVRFVRLWFVDVLGVLKSLSIPASEVETALEEGVGIFMLVLAGGRRTQERARRHRVPRRRLCSGCSRGAITAVGPPFCTIRQPDGKRVRRRQPRRAPARPCRGVADLGWTTQVGAEIEFFLFADDGQTDQVVSDPAGRGLVLRPHAARR